MMVIAQGYQKTGMNFGSLKRAYEMTVTLAGNAGMNPASQPIIVVVSMMIEVQK
jgi:hypothetical protein